jgi:signal transduction histidine kinase
MTELGRIFVSAVRSGFDRLGGPTATAWTTLLAMTAVLVLDRLGTDLERTGRPLALVTSGLVGGAAIAAVARLGRATVLRRVDVRRRPGRATTVALSAALGAALLGREHDRLVGLPVDAAVGQTVERTLWGFGFVVILTVAIDAATEHRAHIDRLLDRTEALRRARTEIDARLAVTPQADLDQVAREVRSDLALVDADDGPGAVALLRHAAEETVRLSSHELARPAVPFRPAEPPPLARAPDWQTLLVDATTGRLTHPLVPAAVAGLWAVATSVGEAPLVNSLTSGVVLATITLVVLAAAGRGTDRLIALRAPRPRVALRLTTALVASLVWLLAGVELLEQLDLPTPPSGGPIRVAAQAALFTVLQVAQSLGRAARQRGQVAISELERLNAELAFEVARANTLLWSRRRDLARQLHGPVQAAINAATLRVDAAVRAGRPLDDDVARARREVLATLDEVAANVASGGRTHPEDLDEALDRARGLWDGICRIDAVVPPDVRARLAADPVATAATIDLVTEACSNAVRHGTARRVEVRLALDDVRLVLTVTDDGTGLLPGPSGQGSALLDEVALSWERTSRSTGGDGRGRSDAAPDAADRAGTTLRAELALA